jgi:uncharacterized protein (TIGR02594 family)
MDQAKFLTEHCPWMGEMQKHLGKAEVPGPTTAGFIAHWLKKLGTPWRDDETPWCGTAVAGCLEALDMPYPKAYYRARAWVGFGRPIATSKASALALRRLIPYGALMVLDRPPRASDGHVGFYAGSGERSDGPAVSLLGGNQGNKVSYATFPMSRVIYVAWLDLLLDPYAGQMLVAKANGKAMMPPASRSEA